MTAFENLSSLSDEALAARVADGNSSALEMLMHRYRGRIYALLLRATGRPSDAEDLCQETWIRLARRAQTSDPSGAAVHVALELAKEVDKGKTIVTVLPDSGNAYITKCFSDEWMKDMGFMEEKGPGSVRDVLRGKQQKLITGVKGEKIGEVIETMKKHGISQMPVLATDGTTVGMIHEYDLLNGLIAGNYKLVDAIDALISPLQGVVTMDTTIPQLRAVFAQDNVAVVREGQKIVAILTKIDLIEFLAER